MRSRSFFHTLIDNWPAKVLSIVAAIVLFMVYRINVLEERFFSVPLKVITNEKYIPAGPYPRNVRITLRGNRDEIFLILEEDIEATLDISGYQTEGQFKSSVEIEKSGTALEVDPLEINVDPYEITLTLEEKASKTLEVFPSIAGYPVHGYELAQYYLNPTYVRVEGPRKRIAEMRTILTEEIDMSGKKENFTLRVRLAVEDPLLFFPGGNVVEFNGIIQESVILKTFEEVEIITLDLDPKFTVTGADFNGIIRVQGSMLILEDTRPEEVRLVIDCSEIVEEGSYLLPVRPDIPLGLLVLKFEPQSLRLTVEQAQVEAEGE